MIRQIWTNFGKVEDFEEEEQAAAACSTYHWHSDVVRALQFSADGSYLLSGGTEGVLVQWQLEIVRDCIEHFVFYEYFMILLHSFQFSS